MTCKRRKRAYGCKGASAVHRQCPGIVRTGGKFLHVIARSEATRQSASPAAAHSGELRLRRIRKASRIRPNCCHLARFLCGENGLPRQCAHWLAMTCRRQRRVSGCKNVGRNDMQKAETCLRVQGRFGSTPAVPRYCADRRQVFACHCEERSDVAIRFSCSST